MDGQARRLPLLTLALAAAFVGAHIAFTYSAPVLRAWLSYTFALYPIRFVPNGPDSFAHWYDAYGPLIGHVFLHAGWIHLALNTLFFLLSAPAVEQRLGAWRTLALFIVSAAAGAAAYVLINPGSTIPAIGAGGAMAGIYAGYYLAPTGADWRWALSRRSLYIDVAIFLLINVGLAALARTTGFLLIAWEMNLGGFIAGALAFPVLARPARASVRSD